MGKQLSLSRLKWFAIVAPLTFLVVVGYLVRGPFHHDLHAFPGYLLVLGVLTVAVSVFSYLVFGIIGRVERRMLEQNEQLAALLAVARAGSSSLALADVLDAALEEVLSVTSAEIGEVWLVADGQELELVRERGIEVDAFRERTHLRLGEGLSGLAAESGFATVVDEVTADPLVRARVTQAGFGSFCALPLVRRGETVGVLAVASRSPAALSRPAERRLLQGIGEQLVIAIENAQLHERVLDAAVLEERERIAHELHDGLAQVLGFVNTQTLAIEKLLSSGRTEDAGVQVVRMRDAARGAYTDVREAILGLRSAHDGLLPSLRSYLADHGRMTGVLLELKVGPGVEHLRLPPAAEIQLIRIVQEALTNVRKHARAASSSVSLDVQEETLAVEVVDDGRGFDLDQPVRTGWPRFGVQTMRERAQAIGGTFELWSTPGSGTRVTVHVPVQVRTRVRHASPAR
jgi:signal transduction histidine kinase